MNSFPNRKDLEKIVERYLSGTANADEIKFVEEYYNFLGEKNEDSNPAEDVKVFEEANFKAIQEKIASTKKSKIKPLFKYISAAAILAVVFGGLYYSQIQNSSSILSVAQTKKNSLDILPSTNKATLTLADGSTVILDENTSSDIS